MLFEAPSGLYDLARVRDFASFPLPLMSKLRFARLMLYAYGKHDWTDWSQRSGDELIDAHADRDVRRVLFEPLVQLKFRRSCAEISGEWIGVRLSYREGAAPLGFIGDANWTTLLCQGLERLLRERGVEIRTEAVAHQLVVQESAASQVLLANGERLDADLFVSTVPTTVYRAICPCDQTPQLKTIEYTALLSMVCATREPPPRDFYWLNLATRRHAACGLFNLSSLNPTIGHRGETCLNFVTHLPETNAEYRRSEDEIVAAYLADYRRLFGRTLRPTWVKVSRIPIYSPVFVKGYAPPPPRSVTAGNVYFAGNYAGAPTIASTGSALQSGLDAARSILRDAAGTQGDAFPAILRE
jgi:protoporphyrinogen oxidase